MTLNTGDVLHNRYRIVKLLAQGGFGTLYRAWDDALGKPCVVKENLTANAAAQRQFLHEAKILANLSHPNLPRVTDYFLEKDQYLVMDYIEGQDLQQMLEDRGRPFDEDQCVVWALQVCDALFYLHTQPSPVIHRDIKPANIRITPSGKAVLVDFGIAKVYDPTQKTTQGAQAVSPGYSPYEQYGKGKTDPRTDIYALGATIYTLVTGEEPLESIQRVVSDPLVPPRQLNPNLSMRLSAALMRAMQMDATQRFQNAADFKHALTPPIPIKVPQQTLASSQTYGQAAASIPALSSLPWGWLASIGLLLLIIGVLLFQMFRVKTADSLAKTLSSNSTQETNHSINTGLSAETNQAAIGTSSKPSFEVSGGQNPTMTPLVYVVEPGDTCSEIADAYGVSMQEIVSENLSLEPDCSVLYAGQLLLIPQLHGPLNTPSSIQHRNYPIPQISEISRIDGMRLVYIPAGEFKMGAVDEDLEAGDMEMPQHVVYLSAFWFDFTEVTNRMYALCESDGDCKAPESSSSKTRPDYYKDTTYGDYPVINVNWEDAVSYCNWAGRRLPTEAEWEKAARGTEGWIFPWGDTPVSMRLANFGSLLGDTNKVDAYPAGASPYGVLDMAGNVSEWVADWYKEDYYTESPYNDPLGPGSGDFRVLRGGSWFNLDRALRTTFRLWNYPELHSDTIGFRCAK